VPVLTGDPNEPVGRCGFAKWRSKEVSGAAYGRVLRVPSSRGEDTMALSQFFKNPRTAAGVLDIDPDHHLWRNGRLFWVAFTVHLPPWQKERVRLSLGTADLHEARRRRDELLQRYPEARGCALSLRVKSRKADGGMRPAA